MGCNMSRLEEDKNVHAKLLPFSGPIEDVKHQCHESKETSNVESPKIAEGRKNMENNVKDPLAVVAAENDIMKIPNEVVIKRNANEDEFPGSPSFRIFITDADRLRSLEGNSMKAIEEEEETVGVAEKEKRSENYIDTKTSNEDSFGKQQKKETWSRLKALTRASSRMYNYLAPKNCHVPVNASETSNDDKPKHHPALTPMHS